LIAIIGDFESGSAEETFFNTFKTDFINDVVPKEYRSQVINYKNESEALFDS